MPLARLAQVHPLHGSCLTHESHWLDCSQHEDLRSFSDWLCRICRQIKTKLVTDHDQEIGKLAVRGTLCVGCNGSYIRRVDSGEYPIDETVRDYLYRPWYLAREGRTLHYEPRVSVSVNDLSDADRAELGRVFATVFRSDRSRIDRYWLRGKPVTIGHPGVAACLAANDLRPLLRLLRMAYQWRRPDIDIAATGPTVPGGHAALKLQVSA